MKNKAHERTLALLGEHQFQLLRKSKVAIIGVGGVGGYAAEAMVRSGVGNILLVDFDVFEESNLNRQLGALQNTISKTKVDVFRDRFHNIHPEIKIETIHDAINSENVEDYLNGYEYILDMCDDLNAKVAMIEYAYNRKIPLVSAMGAGNRMDISALTYSTLDKTRYCALAKRLRKRIPTNIQKKTPVLFYDNEMECHGLVVGTISYAPAYMGIRAAAEMVQWILRKGE